MELSSQRSRLSLHVPSPWRGEVCGAPPVTVEQLQEAALQVEVHEITEPGRKVLLPSRTQQH